MGKFTHSDEQLCPTLWAKLPNALGRYEQRPLLTLLDGNFDFSV